MRVPGSGASRELQEFPKVRGSHNRPQYAMMFTLVIIFVAVLIVIVIVPCIGASNFPVSRPRQPLYGGRGPYKESILAPPHFLATTIKAGRLQNKQNQFSGSSPKAPR